MNMTTIVRRSFPLTDLWSMTDFIDVVPKQSPFPRSQNIFKKEKYISPETPNHFC